MYSALKILVIDDDVAMLGLIFKIITRCFPGSQVDIAGNPCKAIELLGCSKYGIIASDLDLKSNVNGMYVLAWGKIVNPSAGTLLLSGDFEDENIVSELGGRVVPIGIDLGVDDFLKKPFTLNEIEGKLRRMANGG